MVKKFLTTVLTVLLLLQSVQLVGFAAGGEKVVWEQNFDRLTDAGLRKEFTITASADMSVGLVEDKVFGGKALLLSRGSSASGTIGISKSFGALSGKAMIEFSVKATASNMGWRSLYFGSAINLFISGSQLGVHQGNVQPTYANINVNDWNDIRVEVDIAAETFDLYLNYDRVAKNISYRNKGSALNSLNFSYTVAGDMYLDNFRITTMPVTVRESTAAQTAKPAGTAQPAATAVPAPKPAVSAGQGQTLIPAVKDGYTTMTANAAPTAEAKTLQVSGAATTAQKRAYLGFDAIREAADKKAELYLYKNASAAGSETLALYAADDTAWEEQELTAKSAPAIRDFIAAQEIDAASSGWIRFDITDFVHKNGDEPFTLVLAAESVPGATAAELSFDSREGSAAPQILLSDGGETAAAATELQALSVNAMPNLGTKLKNGEEIAVSVLSSKLTNASDDVFRTFFKSGGAQVRYVRHASARLVGLDRAGTLQMLAGDKPDVIVVDIGGMNEEKAAQLAGEVRASLPMTEWIFVTGNAEMHTDNGIMYVSASAFSGAYPVYDGTVGGAVRYDAADFATKTDVPADNSAEHVATETFDGYKTGELGAGWRVDQAAGELKTVSDAAGGNYLLLDKTNPAGAVMARKYMQPVGGPSELSFQLAVFDTKGTATVAILPYIYENVNLLQMDIKSGKLVMSNTEVMELEQGRWYNMAIQFDFDKGKYNFLVNGEIKLLATRLNSVVKNFESVMISAANGATASIGLDNINLRFLNEMEEEPPLSGGVFYHNDFSGKSGTVANDTAGTISYRSEGDESFIRAERTSNSGSCSTYLYLDPTKGDVTVEMTLRLNDSTGATKVLYLNSPTGSGTAQVYFSGTDLTSIAGSNREKLSGSIPIGSWFKLRLDLNMSAHTFDTYVDGALVHNGSAFASASDSIGALRFAITAGEKSSFDMSEIRVSELSNATGGSQTALGGYDDTSYTVKLSDGTKKFQSAPDGIVVEAEDMELYRYQVEPNYKAHNDKGIFLADGGFGSVSCRFTGQSGYYAINVAYYEGDGEYTGYYYLKQNGEVLDWWQGEFNDEVLHVRNAKVYQYLSNGDMITVCGSGKKDPASIDYVEFKPAQLNEFSFGELLCENSYKPGPWRSSGWDADESGGSVGYGVTLTDTRTDAATVAIRKLSPFYKSFVLDIPVTLTEPSRLTLTVGSGTVNPVRVDIDGRSVTAGGQTMENSLKLGVAGIIRMAVDAEAKTYDVLVDGTVLAENIPFAGSVERFDVFKMTSGVSETAFARINNVRLTAGYLAAEDFRVYASGTKPYDWKTEGSGEAASMASQDGDKQSMRLGSGAVLSKQIAPAGGTLTYEAMLLSEELKNGAAMKLRVGGREVGITTADGDWRYTDGLGGTGVIWENYMENMWYHLKIVIDTENGKADFSVNDFKKLENIPVASGAADEIIITAGRGAGSVWADDILLFSGEYVSDVPDAEAPELRGDYNIGMMTCDLWKEGHHFGYDSMSIHDPRIPLIGYAEDGNQESSDWEFKYMIEHGINIYMPCWYIPSGGGREPIKQPRNSAKLNQGYMNSRFQDRLRFSLIVTTISAPGSDEFYYHQVRYWIERYFRNPSYWIENNKPVIMTFVSLGDAKAYETINQMLIDAGFDGAIFVGPYSLSDDLDYYYNYSSGKSGKGRTLVTTTLSCSDKTFIASPSQGWGNVAWGRQDQKVNIPINEWHGALEWIRDSYFTSFGSDDLRSRTVLLDNWNEYQEGHFLAPTRLAGFGYLDVIRDVFTKKSEHEDILPEKRYDWLTPILW